MYFYGIWKLLTFVAAIMLLNNGGSMNRDTKEPLALGMESLSHGEPLMNLPFAWPVATSPIVGARGNTHEYDKIEVNFPLAIRAPDFKKAESPLIVWDCLDGHLPRRRAYDWRKLLGQFYCVSCMVKTYHCYLIYGGR